MYTSYFYEESNDSEGYNDENNEENGKATDEGHCGVIQTKKAIFFLHVFWKSGC